MDNRLDNSHTGIGSEEGEMTKVAIYARVSTDDKDQNPETQLRPLRYRCESLGYDSLEYSDSQTGRSINRPEYQRMLSESGRWDGVLVFAADRLTREGPERGISEISNLLAIGKWFEISGGLRVIGPRMDPEIKLTLRLLFTVAAFESDMISKRVAAGMERVKAEKGSWPWQKLNRSIIESILLQRNHGKSMASIAREHGLSVGTVFNVLHSAETANEAKKSS